jgi:hypothetical protein
VLKGVTLNVELARVAVHGDCKVVFRRLVGQHLALTWGPSILFFWILHFLFLELAFSDRAFLRSEAR